MYELKENEETFATASELSRFLRNGFQLTNSKGESIATAKPRFFSWGMVVDIKDTLGNSIGRIEQEHFLLMNVNQYRIYNHQNELVAKASMNFLSTTFDLHHPNRSDLIYATLSRYFMGTQWKVEIKAPYFFKEQQLDPSILVFLGVYQLDKEKREFENRRD